MDPQANPQPTNPQPANPQVASVPPAPAAGTPTPTPAPAATTPAWNQYVGHIVRWEDGTTWLVKEDGRHWIPDGGVYQSLTQKGAQVFNLSAPELDAIPDIKGNHATA